MANKKCHVSKFIFLVNFNFNSRAIFNLIFFPQLFDSNIVKCATLDVFKM